MYVFFYFWFYFTELLGIHDLSQPDYGDPVEVCPGDVPVFWACGVTGAEAVQSCSKVLRH